MQRKAVHVRAYSREGAGVERDGLPGREDGHAVAAEEEVDDDGDGGHRAVIDGRMVHVERVNEALLRRGRSRRAHAERQLLELAARRDEVRRRVRVAQVDRVAEQVQHAEPALHDAVLTHRRRRLQALHVLLVCAVNARTNTPKCMSFPTLKRISELSQRGALRDKH